MFPLRWNLKLFGANELHSEQDTGQSPPLASPREVPWCTYTPMRNAEFTPCNNSKSGTTLCTRKSWAPSQNHGKVLSAWVAFGLDHYTHISCTMSVWGDHVDVITRSISLFFFPFLFHVSSPLECPRGLGSGACEVRVGPCIPASLLLHRMN